MDLNRLISLLDEIFAYEPAVPCQPWSIIELGLTVNQIAEIKSIPTDLDAIIAEGQRRTKNYHIANFGEFNLNEILGLSMLLPEVYEVRDRENNNAYQEAILEMDWQGRAENYFIDPRYPGDRLITQEHNELIKKIILRLNLRNAYNLPSTQYPYQKTYLLQSGLTKSEWIEIISGGIPEMPNSPQIAKMLHGDDNMWRSEEFIRAWRALHVYHQGKVSRGDAESELSASHWIPYFWIKDLLDQVEIVRSAQQGHQEVNYVESGSRNSPLIAPKLLWNQSPFFETGIDSRALNRICPKECLALRLTGPQGNIGEINRADASSPWQRVSGAGITNALAIRISTQQLGSGETTVELRSLSTESDFFTEVTLRLWHDDAIISRFDQNGLLEIDAWHRRLTADQPVTLAVPIGWPVTPTPSRLVELLEPGIVLVHFSGTQRPITVRDDGQTSWWDSQRLEAPSRRIPLPLRQLKPVFVVDQTRATYVTGHLEVPFEFREMIEQVKIGTKIMTWQAARVGNAIRIGTDGFRTESLWHGLKAELLVTIQGQTHKLLRIAPARFDTATPGVVILARLPTGDVKKIFDETSMGTLRQFQMTSFRAIYPRYVPQISVYQNGQMIGIISGKNAQWGDVQHLGIPFQYSYETNDNQNLRVFMEGIEDRGCIASVDLPENPDEARPISILLTNSIEPSPATDAHQGHKILMLIRRKAGERWGLEALASPPDQVACLINADWSTWQVEIPEEGDVVCAVAISYGTTIIGSWVSRRNDDIRQFLRGNDLQNLEVSLLCDCIRLFNPPLFGIGFDRDAQHFFAQHRQAFDQRCAIQAPVVWDGVAIYQNVDLQDWGLILDAINA
jgi:hypothetical protein